MNTFFNSFAFNPTAFNSVSPTPAFNPQPNAFVPFSADPNGSMSFAGVSSLNPASMQPNAFAFNSGVQPQASPFVSFQPNADINALNAIGRNLPTQFQSFSTPTFGAGLSSVGNPAFSVEQSFLNAFNNNSLFSMFGLQNPTSSNNGAFTQLFGNNPWSMLSLFPALSVMGGGINSLSNMFGLGSNLGLGGLSFGGPTGGFNLANFVAGMGRSTNGLAPGALAAQVRESNRSRGSEANNNNDNNTSGAGGTNTAGTGGANTAEQPAAAAEQPATADNTAGTGGANTAEQPATAAEQPATADNTADTGGTNTAEQPAAAAEQPATADNTADTGGANTADNGGTDATDNVTECDEATAEAAADGAETAPADGSAEQSEAAADGAETAPADGSAEQSEVAADGAESPPAEAQPAA